MQTEPGLVTRLCEAWEDARAAGRSVTPEELCRDHPEALADVRAAVAGLAAAGRALAPADPAAAPLPLLPPGCRYRVVKFLAQGGLGRVYVADDLELGRPVAVKFVRPDRATPAARLRFRREAELTGRVEHPGVAPVYGLLELADGGFCYAMRLLDGRPLAAAIDALPAGPARAAALRPLLRHVQAACDAVAFAHSRGVVHRDLKPQNVVVGAFGETWVVDWGLARDSGEDEGGRMKDEAEGEPPAARDSSFILHPSSFPNHDALTVPGGVMGTPGFMAPEQARGEGAGPAADVYALGVTLGCVLVGRAPRADEPVAAWLAAPGVPAALAAVARTAAAPDPAARYPDPRALAAEIDRWLADEPVTAYRDPFTVRAGRWAKRHRTAVVAAAALLVVAGPLGGALALVSDAARRQAIDDQKRVSDEKDRAEKNLEVADRLAGDVIEKVVESPRLKEADLTQARADILAELGAVYARVSAQRAGDPTAAAAVARADRLLGAVYRDLGRHGDAVAALRRAEAALGPLAAADPAAAVDLGRVRAVLGRALYELGRPTEAADVLATARRDLAPAAAPGGPPAAGRYLGLVLNNLGLVLHGLGKHADADEAFAASAAALEPRLAGPAPPDGDARADLAITLSNHGLLLWEVGRRDDARRGFERAIALHAEVAAARPELRSHARLEAFARANLVSFLIDTGEKEAAAAQSAAAVRRVEALAAEFPAVPDYQAAVARLTLQQSRVTGEKPAPRTLAASAAAIDLLRRTAAQVPTADARRSLALGLAIRAQVLAAAGDPGEGLKAAREGAEMLVALVRDHPAEVTYRLDLALASGELGNQLYLTRDFPAAEAAFRRDLVESERLAAEFPTVPEYRERVGRAAYSVGSAVAEGPRPADALPLYERAVEILGANPTGRTNREAVRNAQWGRAELLAAAGRNADAAKAWRGMLAMIPEDIGDHALFRAQLADALLRAGDRAAAAAEADAVLAHPRAPPGAKKTAEAVRLAARML